MLKTISKILVYLVLGIVALFIVISIAIDPIARNYIERKINSADQGQFTTQIDRVNISLLGGNFIIKGIRLETDTVLARQHDTPIVNMDAGEISVEGVSWLDFLLHDTLHLNRASLLDINLEAFVKTTDTEEPTGPFKWDDLNIYPMIKDQVERIRLRDLRFSNIDLNLINVESNDSLRFTAEEFNLHSDDILIDADRVFTDARAFYASRIDIEGTDVAIYRYGSAQWQVGISLIDFETRETDFGMLSEDAFFFRWGQNYEDTIVYAHAKDFQFDELGLNRVQEDSVAAINSIELTGLTFINNIEIEEEEAKSAAEQADKESPGFDISRFTLGNSLPDLLDRVSIQEIEFRDINYRQHDFMDVSNIELLVKELVIDKTPAFANNRFVHAKKVEISIDDFSYFYQDQMMQINMNKFNFAMDNGIGDLQMGFLAAHHQERIAGQPYAQVSINGFNITGINTTALPDKELGIDSISVDYPEMFVDVSLMEEAEETEPVNNLYPFISDYLTDLRIGKIALIDADIQIAGLQENPNTIRLPAVYMQVSDLFIAEGTAFAGRRVFHSEDIAIRVLNTKYPLADNIHTATAELFSLSTREKSLRVDGAKYHYNENASELLKGPEANQLIKISNDHFSIANLEYGHLIRQEGFFAGEIRVEGLQAAVKKDNNYPEEDPEEGSKEEPKTFSTPQQMIKNVELPFYVDSFTLSNALFELEENAEGGDVPGRFSLNDLNLDIENLSNVDNIIGDEFQTRINFTALVMGEGHLESQLIIPMHDETARVNFSGILDTFDLTSLNRYTEYTTLFGFESGTIYTIKWDFDSGAKMAEGEFGLSYENLNIQLSKDESPESAGTLYQIGAYLANALVLDEDISEDRSEPPRTVEFTREREEDEGFIAHYISSLMEGFIEIMGFPLSIIDP